MGKHIDPARIIPCALPSGKRFNNVSGMRFGRLEVLRLAGRTASRMDWCYLWECRCVCGATTYSTSANLKSGTTASCGCLKKEMVSKAQTVHGLSNTPEWDVWIGMKTRCYNTNVKHFCRYGGRGIRVCDSWLSDFEAFLNDMGPRPSPKHSLERRDNNGNYEPSNCYWATASQQARNRRSNVNLNFNGVTLCYQGWDDRLGFLSGTVRRRLKDGWTIEQALTTPVRYVRLGNRPS